MGVLKLENKPLRIRWYLSDSLYTTNNNLIPGLLVFHTSLPILIPLGNKKNSFFRPAARLRTGACSGRISVSSRDYNGLIYILKTFSLKFIPNNQDVYFKRILSRVVITHKMYFPAMLNLSIKKPTRLRDPGQVVQRPGL